MMRWRRSRWLRAALLPALAGFLLTGCMKWSRQKAPIEQVMEERSPSKVRLTLANGVELELRAPRLEGDSLVGLSRTSERMAVATQDVRRVEVWTADGLNTALLFVGVGAAALMVAVAIAASSPFEGHDSGGSTNGMASCPLVYSWDGTAWRLDSGTFGGAIARPLARTDVDNLDFARAEEGRVRLRVAAELEETDHVDALSLLTVDHPRGTTVAPDSEGRIHVLGLLEAPLAARNFAGRNALERVREADGWGWESALVRRDTARAADLRDGLTLEFLRPPGAKSARLVLDAHNSLWAAWLVLEYVRLYGDSAAAWHAGLEADPERARRLGRRLASEGFLTVAVETESGFEPQALVWEAGPEIVKRQVATLDLSRVRGDRVRVRLESVPSFWLVDRAAIDYSVPGPPTVREIAPERATDLERRDVLPRIAARDGLEYVMEKGDAAEVVFRVPPPPPERERSYLLRSTGWYRIHGRGRGEPDRETLARIETEPGAIARLAVARLNEAIGALAAGGLQ